MQIWFEDLPNECPPSDAVSPNGQTFYRLINGKEIASEDFVSQRFEFPSKVFAGVDECIVRAVSLHLRKEDCEQMLKFSRHKHKIICAIVLNDGDGLIKKTFSLSHHSWWRPAHLKFDNN